MPLTADRPKCLVSLAGTTLLARLLKVLRNENVEEITIVAGHRSDRIVDAAIDCTIVVNSDYEATNMVASLFCAKSAFTDPESDLIISYSDIAYEPRVLRSLMICDAPIAVAVNTDWRALWELRMENPLTDAETMKLDGNGYIRELGRKPNSYDDIEGQFTGLMKVRADCVERLHAIYTSMDRTRKYDNQPFSKLYTTSFLQYLIDLGWNVRAVPIDGGWLEVDTVDDLKLYDRMANDGTLDRFFRFRD